MTMNKTTLKINADRRTRAPLTDDDVARASALYDAVCKELDDADAAARVAASAWDVMARDASGVADRLMLAPEHAARALVADVIDCPAVELDLGDLLDSGPYTVHVSDSGGWTLVRE